jgi:hypothetical protein
MIADVFLFSMIALIAVIAVIFLPVFDGKPQHDIGALCFLIGCRASK